MQLTRFLGGRSRRTNVPWRDESPHHRFAYTCDYPQPNRAPIYIYTRRV